MCTGCCTSQDVIDARVFTFALPTKARMNKKIRNGLRLREKQNDRETRYE